MNHVVCPTDAFDFSDDSSPGGTEGHKGRSGKTSDKSKDMGSGLKKIFSGPKKVTERGTCLCWFYRDIYYVVVEKQLVVGERSEIVDISWYSIWRV